MSSFSDALIADLRSKKVGLVLGGGGFKGAYQVGAWRALRKLGVKNFHSISGTSVGALNAVLIGLDQMEQAENLWRKVPFTKWSPLNLRYLWLAVACLMGPVIISVGCDLLVLLFSLAANVFKSRDLLVPQYLSCYKHWLLVISNATAIASMVIGFAISLLGSSFGVFITDTTNSWWPMLLTLPMLVVMGTDPHRSVICIGILFSSLLLYFGVRSLGRFHLNGRLLSNEDVIRTLKDALILPVLRSNVRFLFVTIARRTEFRDPLKVSLNWTGRAGAIQAKHPLTEYRWLAEYCDLCKVTNDDEALGILRQTSSLPYAFNGSRMNRKIWTSDGGLADNVPLLPVLMTDVDYVIIIPLNPSEAARLELSVSIQSEIQRQSRERWAAKLSLEEANLHYGEYMRRRRNNATSQVEVADMLPAIQATKEIGVIVLAPSRSLAAINLPYFKFLTGTLNSAIPFRRLWFIAGFRDMSRLLRKADQRTIIRTNINLLEGESFTIAMDEGS